MAESPEFYYWLKDHEQNSLNRSLWIHGKPGVGKSVLCGTAIEYLQGLNKVEGKGHKIAYFFYDYNTPKKRTAFELLTSLLLQLQILHREPSDTLRAAYLNASLYGRSYISDADNISSLFYKVVAELSCSHIVIDALDECADFSNVIHNLLCATSSIPSLRILIFSRDIVDIRKGLRQVPLMHLTADLMKSDITAFLAKSMDSLPCDSQNTKDCIFDILLQKADGMFLFATLACQTLQQATNIDETFDLLASTPSGIYDMYALILTRITTESDRRRSLAQKALRLLCISTRPLTWQEFRIALSWDMDQQKFCPKSAPYKESVLALCCPLIEHRTDTDTFELIHMSLYEFLCSENTRISPPQDIAQFMVDIACAHRDFARMSLAQIADSDINQSVSVTEHPFVAYATMNWCHHLSLSPYDTGLCEQYLRFTACPIL